METRLPIGKKKKRQNVGLFPARLSPNKIHESFFRYGEGVYHCHLVACSDIEAVGYGKTKSEARNEARKYLDHYIIAMRNFDRKRTR